MTRVVFRNAMVWDGSGADSYPADVLVDGGRIRTVAKTPASSPPTAPR